MRLVLTFAVAVTTALAATGLASAQSQVRCSSTMTVNGNKLIVIGLNVGCAEAKPIVRGLLSAPVIGHIARGGFRLLKLRSPRAGWVCVTSTPIRARGAGCGKTGTNKSVIYVNTSVS